MRFSIEIEIPTYTNVEIEAKSAEEARKIFEKNPEKILLEQRPWTNNGASLNMARIFYFRSNAE